jgi:hypothetical protein
VVVSAIAHLAGHDRLQLLLLPEAVDDYVGPDNPVRFIEAFADELDLGAAGFARVVPKATGRPGYDPADLLKLYIYGYLNRVRSSRRKRPPPVKKSVEGGARHLQRKAPGRTPSTYLHKVVFEPTPELVATDVVAGHVDHQVLKRLSVS